MVAVTVNTQDGPKKMLLQSNVEDRKNAKMTMLKKLCLVHFLIFLKSVLHKFLHKKKTPDAMIPILLKIL